VLERLRHIPTTWLHGLTLAIIYGVSVLIAFAGGGLLWWAAVILARLAGWDIPDDAALGAWLWLFWIWGPLGMGFGARYSTFDRLRPEA
jgi:hypothetical protein